MNMKKQTSARARTISMFTGQTDEENSSRDGTEASDRKRARALKVPGEWQEVPSLGLSRWFASGHREIEWRKDGRYYFLRAQKVVSSHETLAEAIASAAT